jgi:hypothetical protein
MTFSLMVFNIKSISIITISITTVSMMIFNKKSISIQHNDI